MVSFAAQEQENKQIVHQFFELLDRHDTERMDTC
jgi:ketosteroid isomerase-like protein